MSGMAQEIQAAIEQDGGAGLGAAPGTDGETQPIVEPGSPAGAQNTGTPGSGGPPENIPYARFKEVNDRLASLKGYEELAQYGYDPDSLGRLAAFEARYAQDPIGVWRSLAEDLDLPQELKDALTQHLDGGNGEGTPPAGEGAGAKPEATEDPESPRMKEALQWIEQQREREESARREAVIDSILGHWTTADTKDAIETPDHIKLTFISSALSRGGFTKPEEIAEAARADLMAYREQTLGSVVGSRRPGGPLAVPGGAPAPAGPIKHDTLREASKQAIADLQAGRLPSTPGA